MGDTPTTINKPAETVNAVLKVVVDTGINAARVAAISAEPWLGLPVISQLFSFFLGKLESYLYKTMADYATFTVIDLQTGSELQDFNNAAATLKLAQSQGDLSAITKARNDFKASLGKLVRWDGSTSS